MQIDIILTLMGVAGAAGVASLANPFRSTNQREHDEVQPGGGDASPKPPKFELVVAGTDGAVTADLTIPPGFHDDTTLCRLKDANQLFSGLVVSIAMRRNARALPSAEILRAASQFVQGLLRDTDFGCRIEDHEFLLISQTDAGRAGQRHLDHLSERVWDFQLRSLSPNSMLFSVGGINVQRQSLSAAIVSARERMVQTRRSD